ncbi:hypothetical protein SFRURICE_001122, partial [Spodoptera frugiperda]
MHMLNSGETYQRSNHTMQFHTFYPRKGRQRCTSTLRHVMPLSRVHPFFIMFYKFHAVSLLEYTEMLSDSVTTIEKFSKNRKNPMASPAFPWNKKYPIPTRGAIPSFPIFLIPDSSTILKFLTPKSLVFQVVTPLVFQVSIGGGDCLPSDTIRYIGSFTGVSRKKVTVIYFVLPGSHATAAV